LIECRGNKRGGAAFERGDQRLAQQTTNRGLQTGFAKTLNSEAPH
jgi:hypothetical protein